MPAAGNINDGFSAASAADEQLTLILLGSILFFFLAAAVILGCLLYSRSRKNRRELVFAGFQSELEKALLQYLFEETDLRELMQLPVMRRALENKRMNAALLTEVLKLHSNFSGTYALRLEAFYNTSGLHEASLVKLKNHRWDTKCKGIAELAQMNSREAYETILHYTNSGNDIVRREAQIAVLKLNGFSALKFLDGHMHPISEWEQLNFIAILSQTEKKDIPDFSVWLHTTNESLRVFILRLIAEFGQSVYVPEILRIYGELPEASRIVAAGTLCRLHASGSLRVLLHNYAQASVKMRAVLLEAVGCLGGKTETDFLKQEAGSDHYAIRFQAVKALAAISGNTAALEQEADEELERIIMHINDKRING